MRNLLRALLAALVIAIATAPAGAVQLLINGTTPAVRLQRIADHANVPTYPGPVAVHIGDCPGFDADTTLGCAIDAEPMPQVWLAPGRSATEPLRDVELHELAHVFDFRMLTPLDRARFMGITLSRAPAWEQGIPWIAPEPREQWPDAYRLCAEYPSITPAVLEHHGKTGWGAEFGGRRAWQAAGQVNATCRLIREIAAR